MRKGILVAYTQPCTEHAGARRRHPLEPEHGRRALHAVRGAACVRASRDLVRRAGADPRPGRADRECLLKITVPSFPVGTRVFGRWWLTGEEENFVEAVCAVVIVVLIAVIVVGSS
jgi:hypothetical protein